MNRVTIMGHLGKNPETKFLPTGTSVTNIVVATTDKWKDKEGNAQEKTEWHRITFWGKQGEAIAKFFQKGSMILVEGKLQTRSWEDDKGVKKYSTEIQGSQFYFCGSSKKAESSLGADVPSFDSGEEINF